MNVLLITTDQQRADTLGVEGNPVCRTPHADALAAAGTRFARAVTPNPFCQPARASILTGQHPSGHGVTFNGVDLPEDATAQSVATAFARAGHATGFFGKAHFATTYPFFPTNTLESVAGSALMPVDWTGPYFGFDFVQLMLFGHSMRTAPLMGLWNWHWGPPPFGLHYARHLYRDGRARGDELLRLMQPEAAGAAWDRTQTWASAMPEEEHPTTWVADSAIEWLGRQDGPFMGWVSFTDPHHPFDAPGDWATMYDPADVVLPERHPEELDTKPGLHRFWTTGGNNPMFEWANPGGANLTDAELARMIAGYYGLVSMLDHHIGRILGALDELGLAQDTLVLLSTDHGELLGDHQMIFKGPMHYEGLLRVPLIARGPGATPGEVVTEPVSTVDLAPTMLTAAGIPVPDHMEGRDLLGGPRRDGALTEDDFNAVIPVPLRTLTTTRYRITRWMDNPGDGELYDHDDDPGEFVNRWHDPAYTAVRDDLLAELADQIRPTRRDLPKVGLVA